MKAVIVSLIMLTLAACGNYKGLQNAPQLQARESTLGITVSTNIANGGMAVSVGKKDSTLTLNSNTMNDGDGNVRQLDSEYGGGTTRDARSMFAGNNMAIEVDQGAAIGGGDVVSFGTAATIFACQQGAVTSGNTGEHCMDMFRDNDGGG